MPEASKESPARRPLNLWAALWSSDGTRGGGPLLAGDSTAPVAAASAEPEPAGAGEDRRSAHSDPLPCWGGGWGRLEHVRPCLPPPPVGSPHPTPGCFPAAVSLPLGVVCRTVLSVVVICRVSFGFRITQHEFPRFPVTGNRTFVKRNVGIQCTSFLFLTLFQLLENTKWISSGRLKSPSKSRWVWLPSSGRRARSGEGCWSESRRSSL